MKKILIVEDQVDLLQVLVDKFTREGFSVFEAKNGEEGLELALKDHPDLILLDLNLPKKDGRELLAEIKFDERLKHIPVVVLTTSEALDDIARCYDLNANCYICKPVDLDDFFTVVRCITEFWLKTVKLPLNE